jgi:hypothetical protein
VTVFAPAAGARWCSRTNWGGERQIDAGRASLKDEAALKFLTCDLEMKVGGKDPSLPLQPVEAFKQR